MPFTLNPFQPPYLVSKLSYKIGNNLEWMMYTLSDEKQNVYKGLLEAARIRIKKIYNCTIINLLLVYTI